MLRLPPPPVGADCKVDRVMWASAVHDRRCDGRAEIDRQFDCELSSLFAVDCE